MDIIHRLDVNGYSTKSHRPHQPHDLCPIPRYEDSDLGTAGGSRPHLQLGGDVHGLLDTPTPEGGGILSSTTTARHAWSDTVSLSVQWLAPPRSRVPRGTDLASQSRDCLSSSLGGELGSRNPNASCSFNVLPGQGLDRIHREVSGRNRQRRVLKERSLAERDYCTWTHAFIPPLKGVGFRLIFCKISSQPCVGC